MTKLRLFGFLMILSLTCIVVFSQVKVIPNLQKPPDPVVNFKLTLPQASSVIYAIRYSTFLDAKTANELADLLVNQANDTTLNRPLRLQSPVRQK